MSIPTHTGLLLQECRVLLEKVAELEDEQVRRN